VRHFLLWEIFSLGGSEVFLCSLDTFGDEAGVLRFYRKRRWGKLRPFFPFYADSRLRH
jgi:hypothetical protein